MKIIGIDLGTTNTYIYGTTADPDSPGFSSHLPEPLVLPGLSDDHGSIASVVMYENGNAVLAGNIAESEFYANARLRGARRLASQFKPEIAQNQPGAIQATTDFLRLLLQAFPAGALEEDTRIYVGIPSLSREDFSLNLKDCFRRAGWPAPYFARESDAAMVSCLQSGVLDINDIERRCLILDFGGGTFDYTCVESMDAVQNGGDLLYGGRLFDDLVFQVFCRHDPVFAREISQSPYAWHAHWIECRHQKEKFSDYLAMEKTRGEPGNGFTLHLAWYDKEAQRHDSFVPGYNRDDFIRDAENYQASPEMLEVLAAYTDRGGLGSNAIDLLAGKRIGLISWLRDILESIGQRRAISKAVLTGGSARWFFVPEICAEMFPAATCAPSVRGYEDIAFGLALYPVLNTSHARVQRLLNERIGIFTTKAVGLAQSLARKNARELARLCADRIVTRDVMPALEAASGKGLTIADLEMNFQENIKNDTGLLEIAREKSRQMGDEIQSQLNLAFRQWLKENGVLLVPVFVFPAAAIGDDFFANVSVKISRLDSLNLMKFTITRILPILAATATAGVIAHSLEPVSTVVGGGVALGATWLTARAAPSFLEKRKLPAFFLNEKNRRKIIDKNRVYIERTLRESLEATLKRMSADIERKLREALVSMLGSLTALNQVKVG